ncbi:hypothetical protein BDQ94DRAFT_155431 [Aspergillus welwitschiae]|uniref:Uncharacterized protein n=1 Tax=Aspergillus welwitschiae TaxID=1341132 RepID=A0A3F3PIG7_9EURO|nr:hypothetical protein BDQ94DRAFT_155431 [Aspergillus welwitschiae]RDH26522.1 hypothetical protein BDQ94DRAFT_155431 [Aspergillus welwitschiae]
MVVLSFHRVSQPTGPAGGFLVPGAAAHLPLVRSVSHQFSVESCSAMRGHVHFYWAPLSLC